MNWEQIIGLAAGILTSASLIPQVIKTIKQKKADDISLKTLIVLLTGQILWVVYGIMKSDFPIIATNSFSILVDITMVVLRIKYNRNK